MTNLPPGVSSADPHFYPPDEPDCECGHPVDEHGRIDDDESCNRPGCDCDELIVYDPDPEDHYA